MSVCNPSIKAQPIPNCVVDLVVGTITSLNTSVNVYVKNIVLQKTEILTGGSDGAGLVTVDVESLYKAPEHAYELWITLAGDSLNERQDITIGAETEDTVLLSFESVYQNNAVYSYAIQTLS